MGYIQPMKYTLETTKQYDKWFRKLKDSLIRIKILARLRVYYTVKDKKIVVLLAGGDKSSQQNDIDKARLLLKQMEE